MKYTTKMYYIHQSNNIIVTHFLLHQYDEICIFAATVNLIAFRLVGLGLERFYIV